MLRTAAAFAEIFTVCTFKTDEVQKVFYQVHMNLGIDGKKVPSSLIAARTKTDSRFVPNLPLKRYRQDSSCPACGKEGHWWKKRLDRNAKMREKLQRRRSSIKQRSDDTCQLNEYGKAYRS